MCIIGCAFNERPPTQPSCYRFKQRQHESAIINEALTSSPPNLCRLVSPAKAPNSAAHIFTRRAPRQTAFYSASDILSIANPTTHGLRNHTLNHHHRCSNCRNPRQPRMTISPNRIRPQTCTRALRASSVALHPDGQGRPQDRTRARPQPKLNKNLIPKLTRHRLEYGGELGPKLGGPDLGARPRGPDLGAPTSGASKRKASSCRAGLGASP